MLSKYIAIEPNLCLRIKPSIIYTELDNGEAVLLNFETKHFYGLNEMAVKIWKLLDGKNTINDIIEKVVSEYDIDRQNALKSITRQIKKLIKEKIVEEL